MPDNFYFSVKPDLPMTTSDFMRNSDCFKSFTALREAIYYDRKLESSNPEVITSMVQHARVKKPVSNLINFKNDKSVIIAIQNDSKFINMIMNCRKQSSPIAHIFVEANQYVSCIIKNANGYPIIFIRIPIDNVYAYAQATQNIYEFPIQKLLEKEVKFTRNSVYTMIFRYDGQNVSFTYELYSSDNEPSRIDINNISTNNQAVINSILNCDTEISMHSMSSGVLKIRNPHNQMVINNKFSSSNENYLLSFVNMNVNILREVQDISNVLKFELKPSSKPQNYFIITSTEMTFISETSSMKNVKYVCSSSDSLIWTDLGADGRYELLPFSPLFKVNYNKSITTNDKLYYIFASYLNNFMFVKLITSYDVSKTNHRIKTLSKLFPKEYQILECYVCVKS